MSKTYAIGDIHGSLRKLRSVIVGCERDAGGEPHRFVFVGDYIDRGPDSRGVVEFLIDLQSRNPGTVCLTGNHEALALAALDSRLYADNWLMEGGEQTLRSYGVASVADLPARHVAWLKSLPLSHDDGLRFFVHAGVDPARPLDRQNADDLIWIREPFLSDTRDYGRLIVHGHTPLRSGTPDLRANRLNLDTAAVYGGPLTAAVFTPQQAGPVGFLRAPD